MNKEPQLLSRRAFLQSACSISGLAFLPGCGTTGHGKSSNRYFKTRGVVLVPGDLSLGDWPERARQAGLTTIALHHSGSPREVVKSIQSGPGQQFLARCRQLNLEVEYELHAIRELLPRALFAEDPSLFRMNEKGERTPDSNCCVHSRAALEIIGQNAVELARLLRPTSHRYFYWGDDGRPWCRCPLCRPYSDSDQAVLLENSLVLALRRHDSRATLAHLAYSNTLSPPTEVKPNPHLFLEFAPINRRHDIPYAQQAAATDKDGLPALDANLKVFPAATAQILEYWLDVSRASGWRRPAKKLPWYPDVFVEDLRAYRARGLRHVTTFAAWVDGDYLKRHGPPDFIGEYGGGFSRV